MRLGTLPVLVTVCVLAAACAGPAGRDAPAPSLEGTLEAQLASRAVQTMTPLPDGSLLVAGGCVEDGCGTASDSAFAVSTGGVLSGPSLGQARDAHTATMLTDGRVLVTGGFAGEGTPPLSTAEVFDPASRSWNPVGPMATGRGGHAAARLGDGRVVVAGGWVGPRTYTATTEIFDPGTGRFTPGPALPVAADGLAAASLPDGCVLVVGGQSSPGVSTDAAVTICAGLDALPVGRLGTGRFKHGIATLPSGDIVVIGGTTDDRHLLASTEVYDGASRAFRPGPTLVSQRYKLGGSVATLPDGRIVVAGGGSGVEVLDLVAGSRLVPAAGNERSSFSTVGLTGSRVVIVGGYDEIIRLTRQFVSLAVADL